MAHPLSGADIATLRHMFRDAGGPANLRDRIAIWGAVLGRFPATALERSLIEGRLPQPEDMPPPVFILGHWRSGTTHLYNIMSLHGWGYVPPVATGLPHDLFGIARLFRPLLERQLPDTRFIDNIPVTPTSPQEDEIAVANMSPISFYHGIYFPQAFDRLIDRGLFFDGCDQADIDGWSERFLYLMRKLALDQKQRLLIKNPVYTARPALLKRLFPGAKFIHIHRNPHDVFRSMRNFYTRLLAVLALQPVPEPLDIDATILRVYSRMMRTFVEETAGLSAPDIVEIPYQRLDTTPLDALSEIYGALELTGIGNLLPKAKAYLGSIESYEKNRFSDDPGTVAMVEDALGPWFDRWGYPRIAV